MPASIRAFASIALLLTSSTVLFADDAPKTPIPAGEDPAQCVILRNISGWSRVDDRTLLLRSVGRRYKVHFDAPCYEANWAFSARVDHPGMCLRPGDMLVFEIDSSPMIGPGWNHRGHRGFEERCLVKAIERIP